MSSYDGTKAAGQGPVPPRRPSVPPTPGGRLARLAEMMRKPRKPRPRPQDDGGDPISEYPAQSPDGAHTRSVDQDVTRSGKPHEHLVKDRRSFTKSNLGGR